MTMLLLGLVIFLGVHSVSAFNHDARNRMVQRLGEKPWKGLYSLLSLLGFALLCYGYGQARMQPVVLYQPPHWMRHVTVLLMLPVFVLLVASNVKSYGHIKRITQHPMLLATKIWATAHLLSKGTLAAALLFGGFLAWAVITRISYKRREPAANAATGKPASATTDAVAVLVGLALYAWFFLHGHKWLIGVAPLAR